MRFTLLIILIVLASGNCFSQDQKQLVKEYTQQIRKAPKAKKDTVKLRRGEPAFDSAKYSFVYRRGCYSITSGYRNPEGFIGVKFEDRFLFINSRFQFGLGLGHSTFLGFKVSGGVNYFLTSERRKYMPFVGAQYVMGTGNKLANTEDRFYATIGANQYANFTAGLKIKPFAKPYTRTSEKPTFRELWNVKIILGYTYLLNSPTIDTAFQVPQAKWSYPYRRLNSYVASGFFVAVNVGIDIPYIKKYNLEHGHDQKEINKDKSN